MIDDLWAFIRWLGRAQWRLRSVLHFLDSWLFLFIAIVTCLLALVAALLGPPS